MVVETVTLKLPENLYRRLANHAGATKRPLEEVILHALTVGSPPMWDDVPAEFQAALAEIDRLDDAALWGIAQSRKAEAELVRYDELLEKYKRDTLSEAERLELARLRGEADLFMLRKAHAAALLRWRGHRVPNPLGNVPTHIPKSLRELVRQADHRHCAYCHTSEENSGIPLTLDHVRPISKEGESVFENLCLACSRAMNSKPA